MLQVLRQYFQEQQYRVTPFGGGTAFVKPFPQEVAVVQLCGGEELAMGSRERLLAEREAFAKWLSQESGMPLPIRFLTIVVVPDEVSEYFRNLADETEGVWFVSERQKQLLVFENQSTRYFGLYEPLSEYIQQQDMKKQQRKELVDMMGMLQPVTVVLVLLNIAVYIAAFLHGDVYDAGYMFSIGGITWDSIFGEHQYYRLFTCMFLHYGMAHLAGNMLSLLCLGSMLEKRIGHLRFMLLYLLSGLFGAFASVAVDYYHYIALAQYSHSVSAGASGAIFGVIGGLIAVTIGQRRWKGKRSDFTEISLRSLLLMAFFSLFQGFTTAGVDNSAHLGGLIFGLVFAFLLAIKP